MGKCGGLIFNRHSWYEYNVAGEDPPKGWRRSYQDFRVCRKCGALEELIDTDPMGTDGMVWMKRGRVADFKKLILNSTTTYEAP